MNNWHSDKEIHNGYARKLVEISQIYSEPNRHKITLEIIQDLCTPDSMQLIHGMRQYFAILTKVALTPGAIDEILSEAKMNSILP